METLTENSLIVYLDNNQVEPETKKTLLQSFETFFTQTQEWKEKADGLVITSIEQKAEIKQAKEARMALKSIRVSTEHKRKELKEESLRKGQTIDAIAKIITNEILPIEEHLEKQEKFAEIQEAKRKAELKSLREAELSAYNVEGEFYDLGNMAEEIYRGLLENSRIAHKTRIEAARIEELERIEREQAEAAERAAREKAEAEERERIRLENEQLRKEAEAREAELKKEREAAAAEAKRLQDAHNAKLEAERKEREKLQAELQAKQEAEERAKKEAEAKIEAELSMGDKAKFQSLIGDLDGLKAKYSFKSKKYQGLQASINELLDKTINYAQSKA